MTAQATSKATANDRTSADRNKNVLCTMCLNLILMLIVAAPCPDGPGVPNVNVHTKLVLKAEPSKNGILFLTVLLALGY